MNKVVTIGISLIVGATLGYLIASKTRPAPANLVFNPLVIVGPKEKDVSPYDVHISFKAQKPVTWRTLGADNKLQIIFPEKGFPKPGMPEPFIDMAKVAGPGSKPGPEWVFQHHFSPNVELSGDLNPALQPYVAKLKDGESLVYVYDQMLDGKRADGRIIIDP